MPQPTGSDLHIDVYLSNLSIAYMNEPSAYIADRVFPVVMTPKQSDKYPIYEKDYWFRDGAAKRAVLTESAGGGYELADPGEFFCDEWGYHKDIPDQDIWNEDDIFDLDQEAVEFVIEKFRIRRERDWASKYFQSAVWGTDWTGGVDFTAWSTAGSTPIQDVETAKTTVKESIALTPNTLVVSEKVFATLKNHAAVLDRFKYTQSGVITEALLALVFGVDNFFVASAVYASNAEGDAEVMDFIVSETDALLVYVQPRPAKRRPSGGYTFRWSRPMIKGREGEPLAVTIKRFYMESVAGTRIEGGVFEDLKLVASDCGLFFSGAIA